MIFFFLHEAGSLSDTDSQYSHVKWKELSVIYMVGEKNWLREDLSQTKNPVNTKLYPCKCMSVCGCSKAFHSLQQKVLCAQRMFVCSYTADLIFVWSTGKTVWEAFSSRLKHLNSLFNGLDPKNCLENSTWAREHWKSSSNNATYAWNLFWNKGFQIQHLKCHRFYY